MTEKEKILQAWERCDECHKHPVGMSKEYVECEYTTWIYCRQDALIRDTVELIKKTPEVVRCKDCRYGQYCTDGGTTYQCFKWNSGEFGVLHEQDWFCADGKKKDG